MKSISDQELNLFIGGLESGCNSSFLVYAAMDLLYGGGTNYDYWMFMYNWSCSGYGF